MNKSTLRFNCRTIAALCLAASFVTGCFKPEPIPDVETNCVSCYEKFQEHRPSATSEMQHIVASLNTGEPAQTSSVGSR